MQRRPTVGPLNGSPEFFSNWVIRAAADSLVFLIFSDFMTNCQPSSQKKNKVYQSCGAGRHLQEPHTHALRPRGQEYISP